MLEKHPNVRYVGCHLGSLEWDVQELAQRLDRYPNMAVDLAARIGDLQILDREEVRQFMIDYQDRLIYATDMGIREESDAVASAEGMHRTWLRDWAYFSTDSLIDVRGVDEPVKSLDLPAKVLSKLYSENAEKWYSPFQ